MKKLEFIRRGSRVKRFHGFHLLMENPVGHHTFNLMGILFCCVPEGHVSLNLLEAAYMHDIAECITGDIPAPFKRKVEGLRGSMEAEEARLLGLYGIHLNELTAQEQRWLKLADSLDGAFHCLEERRLGNTTLDRIFWTFMTYANELLQDNYGEVEQFGELHSYIVAEWRKLPGAPEPWHLENQPHS